VCDLCAQGSYQDKKGGAVCKSCGNSRTYTTYRTGSTSEDACQGPLLNYTIAGKIRQLTDNATVTVTESSALVLVAVSGNWIVRNPSNPYSETIFLMQGDKKTLKGMPTVLLEPMMANIFCYKDTEGHGARFSGYQDKDIKGRKCESPCRNTESLPIGPHCQVQNETSPCGIPQCIWDVDCSAGDGTGYRGLVNKATLEGGRSAACQGWDKDYPHVHTFHPTAYNTAKYGIGKDNYCRNPDPRNIQKPWCYTTDHWTRFGVCSVPECGAAFDYFKH